MFYCTAHIRICFELATVFGRSPQEKLLIALQRGLPPSVLPAAFCVQGNFRHSGDIQAQQFL
jgi:hypothetical protein